CVPLTANFSYNTSNLTASFNDLSSTAIQWHWDFGDGVTSTSQNPGHTYANNGIYDVCLVVTDVCGQADTICHTVTVCEPLDVDFSYSVDNITVTFTDLSNSAIQWFWDFGDGGLSANQNPTHTYPSFGTYEVCLIAFNQCISDTICQTITLQCPPFDANFSFE